MGFSGLTYDEVVKLHSEKIYDVYLMGFLPGFPYLGVLDKSLHVPRLKVPRKYVAAGTVGIGGEQTGILTTCEASVRVSLKIDIDCFPAIMFLTEAISQS